MNMLQRVGQMIWGASNEAAPAAWRGAEAMEQRTLFTGTWIMDVTYETGIQDGTSNTVFFAEKYVRTEQTRQVTIVQDL